MPQEIIISTLLPDRTLECEPYTYPLPQHFIGKEVYWKSDDAPSNWIKYVIAGILLNQYLNKDGSINALCKPPQWEYVLAEVGYINPYNIQEKWHGHTERPTCDELVSEEEYQQILQEYDDEPIIEEFSVPIPGDPDYD